MKLCACGAKALCRSTRCRACGHAHRRELYRVRQAARRAVCDCGRPSERSRGRCVDCNRAANRERWSKHTRYYHVETASGLIAIEQTLIRVKAERLYKAAMARRSAS